LSTTLGLQSTSLAQKESPVKLSANLSAVAGQATQHKLQVDLQIAEGWHTYAKVADKNPSPITSLTLGLPTGVRALGEVKLPAGRRTQKI
jgi:DsbC/DsbD-like thiol-disulfide interchange protein